MLRQHSVYKIELSEVQYTHVATLINNTWLLLMWRHIRFIAPWWKTALKS